MDILNDKIVTIIETLGFSNTKFADAISVSRPTISHIISGRNKPSIDIIQKILAKYPELGYKWFLDDEELEEDKLALLADNQGGDEPGTINTNLSDSSNQQYIKPQATIRQDNASSVDSSTAVRRVERVIMFYSDGTMEVLSGAAQVL